MTRRRRITILLIAVALVALAYAGLLFFQEPSYHGKSLSAWIAGIGDGWANGRREYPVTPEQREALRAMGEPAIRRLIVILQTHDSKFKTAFIEFAVRHPMLYQRFVASGIVEPEIFYRPRAALALGEIGPAARAAIPALCDLTNYPNLSVAAPALAALMKIRGESVTNLFPALEDDGATGWDLTAATVMFMGPDQITAARPIFLREAQSSNAAVNGVAIYYLKYFTFGSSNAETK